MYNYGDQYSRNLGSHRFVYPYTMPFNSNTKIFRMNVSGNGNIMAKPDIAEVILGVQTENIELKIAQNENSIKSIQILNSLTKMGIPEKDIKTDNYTVNTEYDFVQGKQVFRGYRVVHTFKVIIREIQQTGAIVDAAVSSGANIVNNINFTLSNPELYYNEALKLALEDAINKAESIGKTLGVTVVRTPINVTEERGQQPPIVERALLAAPAAATPIREGQINITANIKAVFAYCLSGSNSY